MIKLPTPPVPDLARAEGNTVDEIIRWFLVYYDADVVPWSYRAGTYCVKQSYRGLHDIKLLKAGCAREKIEQSKKSNENIVELAAPIAFGRKTQVFDLPRRKFPFGRDLFAGYRIPFFFTEDGIVKLYYLQPRKEFQLTHDQLCMVATIHKKYLLDTEFFGLRCDLEYVDLCGNPKTKVREVHKYSLADLDLWPESRLAKRLTMISEALEFVRNSGVVKPRKRREVPVDPKMPLFD